MNTKIINKLKEETNNSSYIVYREKYINNIKIDIIYNEVLTDQDKMSNFIYRSLDHIEKIYQEKELLYDVIKNNIDDLKEKNIYVKKTLQRVYDTENKKTKIIIDKPKTENSIRCIPLNSKIYGELNKIRKGFSEKDFFLTGADGIYIEPRVYQNYYKNMLKSSKVKEYNFHVLRHTFATNCIEVGMDIKSLSEILGHATVDITLNRYVHSSRKMKEKYLEKL